jgi:alpha-ketoglutarate-dependent taurine dioxygenase
MIRQPEKREYCEIVRVTSESRELDPESHERVYWRTDGAPLVQGFYRVTWPVVAVSGRFGARAVFIGPYPTAAAAHSGAGSGRLLDEPL